jgi:tetratricopeptide (TPR) repeat protein
MDVDGRINKLWLLLCERSPAGKRRRSRLCVALGLAILVAGFLVAVGLGRLVEYVVAAAALAFIVAAAAARMPRVWRATRASSRSGWIHEATTGCSRASHALLQRSRSTLASAWAGGSRATRAGVRLMQDTAARFPRADLRALLDALADQGRTRTSRIRLPRPSLPRARLEREALSLNASGVQLRRHGSYSEAAVQHRAALEILRTLGDERSVALTLNNLALALSHDGDDTTAVALFQQAATILGERGDNEDEGQVMANLGLTHRRHGRREEANNVLELALEKLAPASSAYHQVEAELRRAS